MDPLYATMTGETARLSPYLTEAMAALSLGWRVYQRQHLFDISN
jgi:hypothetical protein